MAVVRKLSQSVMTGVLTPTQGQIIRFREHGTENETIDISAWMTQIKSIIALYPRVKEYVFLTN